MCISLITHIIINKHKKQQKEAKQLSSSDDQWRPNSWLLLFIITTKYTHDYYITIHRNTQRMSKRPREGAHLANKTLATARTIIITSVHTILICYNAYLQKHLSGWLCQRTPNNQTIVIIIVQYKSHRFLYNRDNQFHVTFSNTCV